LELIPLVSGLARIRASLTVKDINLIYIDFAELQLQSYYFFDSPMNERQTGILRAYTTAIRLLSKISLIDAKCDLLKYAPISILHAMFIGGAVLFKVLNSRYHQYVNVDEGANQFSASIAAIRKYSILDHDLAFRVANMEVEVWEHYSPKPRDHEPVLIVKSRLSASITHDLIRRWSEEISKPRQAEMAARRTNMGALPSGSLVPFPDVSTQGAANNADSFYSDAIDMFDFWDFGFTN
jgi:hypothetical protein